MSHTPPPEAHNRLVHALAWALAIGTFPLIFIGGLVTSHGAGLAVPDWPNTWGYNMFLFPLSRWTGGIFYEHTHRLAGSAVGFIAAALCIAAWLTDRRPRIRWLATAALGAVIVQGVLGGLRVVLLNLDLAIVHACVGQAFFCLAVATVIASSRWWERPLDAPGGPGAQPSAGLAHPSALRPLAWLAAATAALVYLQLLSGAVMRHYGAGLAIPDFPLSYGRLLPPMDPASLSQVNQWRLRQTGLPIVSLGQVWMHFAHRLGAVAVTVAVIALTVRAVRIAGGNVPLRAAALVVAHLLALQLALGVGTVLLRKPADIASAHVAVGALVLAGTCAISLLAWRLWRAAGVEPAPRGGKAVAGDALEAI